MQTPQETIKLRGYMGRAEFRKGFDDARRNLPFAYDEFPQSPQKQEAYERGRLFGKLWRGTLKIGNKVTLEALYAFQNAYADKTII